MFTVQLPSGFFTSISFNEKPISLHYDQLADEFALSRMLNESGYSMNKSFGANYNGSLGCALSDILGCAISSQICVTTI